MYNVLVTELIKLKRSRALLLSLLVSIVPALVRFIQLTFGKAEGAVNWERFLSSRQEIMVFGMMTAVILLSCFIFGMEYQYNTVSYIFTSRASRSGIYFGKIAVLLVLITLLFMVSLVSNLIFGFITVRDVPEAKLLLKYLETVIWYILAYSALTTIIALVSVVARRFAVSAALVLGYVMMVFPVHLKGNAFICPFMLPSVVSSKILGSTDYFFYNYYKGIAVNYTGAFVFLLVIFIIPLIAGMTYYKKKDAF